MTENGSKVVALWLGDGVGGFSNQSTVALDFRPGGIQVGDFDSDQRLDMAVLDIQGGRVAIFLQR